MTPPTNPMCPHIAECHEHQRDMAATVREAIESVRDDIKDLATAINGNGTPGIKGRLVRLETIVALMAGLAILTVSIGSCAVSNGYLVVPTKAAKVTK